MISLQGPMDIIECDETLEVFREGEVYYVDGKPQKRPGKNFKITCNVQPLSERQLLLVPEGDRYKEQYNVWSDNTDFPVQVNERVKRIGAQDCELKFYQIQGLENWGSYQKFRIMLIDVGVKSND